MARGDDGLLATGEIVVEGTRRDPGGLGDVLDAQIVEALLDREPDRGGAQRLPGRQLLAFAQARRPVRSVKA